MTISPPIVSLTILRSSLSLSLSSPSPSLYEILCIRQFRVSSFSLLNLFLDFLDFELQRDFRDFREREIFQFSYIFLRKKIESYISTSIKEPDFQVITERERESIDRRDYVKTSKRGNES